MCAKRKSSMRPMTSIDLTPLMDLTFILLITFIITFPLIEQGIPIDLPQGNADDIVEEDVRTISMDKKGVIYLDDLPISLEELADEMRTAVAVEPDTTVMVRADEGLVYGKLVEVMRILHEAKITKLALVTKATE